MEYQSVFTDIALAVLTGVGTLGLSYLRSLSNTVKELSLSMQRYHTKIEIQAEININTAAMLKDIEQRLRIVESRR